MSKNQDNIEVQSRTLSSSLRVEILRFNPSAAAPDTAFTTISRATKKVHYLDLLHNTFIISRDYPPIIWDYRDPTRRYDLVDPFLSHVSYSHVSEHIAEVTIDHSQLKPASKF